MIFKRYPVCAIGLANKTKGPKAREKKGNGGLAEKQFNV